MLDTKDFCSDSPYLPVMLFDRPRMRKRRTFSEEDKARIVAESFASGDSVCAVARRHRLSASQLFAWRKNARIGRGTRGPLTCETSPARRDSSRGGVADDADEMLTAIEIAIGAAVIRVPQGADPATLKLVLEALRT